MKVLLLGFGPFLGFQYNPSGKIAEALNGNNIGGFEIAGKVLSVEHVKTSEEIEAHIRNERPDAVLCVGLAASKGAITIERIAINRYCFNDNGNMVDEQISDGPAAYFTTLPFERIKAGIESKGIPAEYSFWGDTYVSNEAFYTIMRLADELGIRQAGFIHVPMPMAQAVERKNMHMMARSSAPSMREEDEMAAIEAAIEACASEL